MRAIVHPFLALLASSSRQDLAGQNQLLKAENKVLRSKMHERIEFTDQDRTAIVKHGLPLGGAIKGLLSIVSYSTFRRWVRAIEDGNKPKSKEEPQPKGGRPKTDGSIRDLVIRMRKESVWGYTKIRQALVGPVTKSRGKRLRILLSPKESRRHQMTTVIRIAGRRFRSGTPM